MVSSDRKSRNKRGKLDPSAQFYNFASELGLEVLGDPNRVGGGYIQNPLTGFKAYSAEEYLDNLKNFLDELNTVADLMSQIPVAPGANPSTVYQRSIVSLGSDIGNKEAVYGEVQTNIDRLSTIVGHEFETYAKQGNAEVVIRLSADPTEHTIFLQDKATGKAIGSPLHFTTQEHIRGALQKSGGAMVLPLQDFLESSFRTLPGTTRHE